MMEACVTGVERTEPLEGVLQREPQPELVRIQSIPSQLIDRP
jgi:hypothetical protein